MGVVSEGGVDDESVGPVATRVIHNGFGAQTGLKFTKSFESVGRKRSGFPSRVLFGQSRQVAGDLYKISNMSSKKVTQT